MSPNKPRRPIDDIDRYAKKAPPNITKYGYAVLFLFAIVSTVAGWSEGRLGTFILIAVVVIGFMFALFAFDRMARSEQPIWHLLGVCFSSIAVAGVLVAFLGTLSYILSGWPPFVGTWFGKKVEEPVAHVDTDHSTDDSLI